MLPAVMAYDRERDSDSEDSADAAGADTSATHDSRSEDVQNRNSAQPSEASSDLPDEHNQVVDRLANKATRAESPSAKSQQRRRMPARSRNVSSDDDYDDDDDDDDDDDEERERTRRARPKRRSLRPRMPRKKLDIPTSEEALNVPKFQTIGMLGSVSLLMIIMWFAARLACNAHPDQIRDPRYVSVDQLARDPKNAALEFQLRYVAKDYLLAGELVSATMADKIHELLKFCEANVDTCDKDRLALKDKVIGSATLLELLPARAKVEVTTLINNANPQTVTLDLIPSGLVWKVTQSHDGGTPPPVGGPAVPEVAPAAP